MFRSASRQIAEYPTKLKPILTELNLLIDTSSQWELYYFKKSDEDSRAMADGFGGVGKRLRKMREWFVR